MNTQEIALDISKRPASAPVITIRQGDRNGTHLDVAISDNGEAMDLAGLGVRLCAKLPDGIHYYSVDGTASGSVASFAIDETYAGAYVGTSETAYIDVLDGDDIICSTHRFILAVEPSAREGAEPGEQYIAEIDAAIARVDEVIGQIVEGAVFGVKGDAEEEYRVGNVNLTPTNIGVAITQTQSGAEITVGETTVSLAGGVEALSNLEIEELLS